MQMVCMRKCKLYNDQNQYEALQIQNNTIHSSEFRLRMKNEVFPNN